MSGFNPGGDLKTFKGCLYEMLICGGITALAVGFGFLVKLLFGW